MRLDPDFEWIDVTPIDRPPHMEYIQGPCRHRHVVPVTALDGEVVAQLCVICDAEFPPPGDDA